MKNIPQIREQYYTDIKYYFSELNKSKSRDVHSKIHALSIFALNCKMIGINEYNKTINRADELYAGVKL